MSVLRILGKTMDELENDQSRRIYTYHLLDRVLIRDLIHIVQDYIYTFDGTWGIKMAANDKRYYWLEIHREIRRMKNKLI